MLIASYDSRTEKTRMVNDLPVIGKFRFIGTAHNGNEIIERQYESTLGVHINDFIQAGKERMLADLNELGGHEKLCWSIYCLRRGKAKPKKKRKK